MKPIKFPEANYFIPASTNSKEGIEKTDLHFFKDKADFVVSCWELSDEEIAKIQETGKIWLILPLKNQPSVGLQTDNPFAKAILDTHGKPIKKSSRDN